MGGTGRPLGKTFFLQCQRRHPELPKIPTYLPTLLADGVPRYAANEGFPWVGVAWPWTRLLQKEGVAVARLIPRAGRLEGRENRQVHAVQAVQELVEEVPFHPLWQQEGDRAPFPQAGGHLT